jgi:hypothetical protein
MVWCATVSAVYVRSDAGVWWSVDRKKLGLLLAKIAMGEEVRMRSFGAHPVEIMLDNEAPRYRPFDWSRDELDEALEDIRLGRLPARSETV